MQVGNVTVAKDGAFFVIAGPCVIEDELLTLEVAAFLRETAQDLEIPIIFKSSYDKANRTSISSFRGPGIEKGLGILNNVKAATNMPVVSDVHSTDEIDLAVHVLDMIQVPAFLCRQTDLVVAAGRSGLPVNLKKGQFLSPWDMGQVVEKVASTGSTKVSITERGTSFGYNNLVVDFRSIAVMEKFGVPIVFDATHSVQLPGGGGTCSGGQREFVGHLSRAAVAAGADGVFMEIHPNPDSARCDGPNSLGFQEVRPLLRTLKGIHGLVHSEGRAG